MASIPMTPRGIKILMARVHRLRHVERPQNVRDIETALDHGDLRENAEYHAAKDRQGQIDGELKWAQSQIAEAQVIDPKNLSGSRVTFGATVTLLDCEDDDAPETRYQIVGEVESDLEQGRISLSSPFAKAMIGKEEGDEFTVITPQSKRQFVIEQVEFI